MSRDPSEDMSVHPDVIAFQKICETAEAQARIESKLDHYFQQFTPQRLAYILRENLPAKRYVLGGVGFSAGLGIGIASIGHAVYNFTIDASIHIMSFLLRGNTIGNTGLPELKVSHSESRLSNVCRILGCGVSLGAVGYCMGRRLEPKLCWGLPIGSMHYVERAELQKDLKLKITENKGTPVALIAMHGTGGVGKTQLMQHYAQNTFFQYKVWFLAETADDLEQKVKSFLVAQQILPPAADSVLPADEKEKTKALQNYFKSWMQTHADGLLCLDNVSKEYAHAILEWLDGSARWQVLMTTRDPHFGGAAIPKVSVDKMEPTEARELFIRCSGCVHEAFSLADESTINDLLKDLDYLALAISTAGKYYFQYREIKSLTLQSLLEELRSSRTAFLEALPEGDLHVSVYAMIKMDWDRLSEHPLSQKILGACAYLGADHIPIDWLRKIAKQAQPEISEEVFIEAMRLLVQLGLLKLDIKNHFKIHRVIQESIQISVKKAKQFESTLYDLMRILIAIGEDSLKKPDRGDWIQYGEHAAIVEKYLQKIPKLRKTPVFASYMAWWLSIEMSFNQRKGKAIPFLEELKTLFKEHQQEKNVVWSGLAFILGQIYCEEISSVSDPAASSIAEMYFKESIRILKELPQNYSEQKYEAAVLDALGRLKLEQNQFEEAEAYLNYSLECKEKSAYSLREIATTRYEIGKLQLKRKDFEKANHYFQDALARYETVYGNRFNMDKVRTLYELGKLRECQNNFVEARSFYQQSLDMRKKLHASEDQTLKDMEVALKRTQQKIEAIQPVASMTLQPISKSRKKMLGIGMVFLLGAFLSRERSSVDRSHFPFKP